MNYKLKEVTSDKEIVEILYGVLSGHGVKDVVCSPGSRNIPLLLGVADRKDIRHLNITDERTAAFAALGLAISTRRPVALVCTSGTALLNYAPAVAEAFYQGIPLILISADRPQEWIDQDDSQTIRQYEALGNIVKKSYDLADSDALRKDGEWYLNRAANEAMLTALAQKQGPVHINVRLSPPLGNMTDKRRSEERIIRRVTGTQLPDRQIIKKMAAELVEKKILLIAGFSLPDAKLNRAVNAIRRHENVVVMAETISNLHLPAEDYVIDSMLCNTLPDEPDVVISIGGAIVSRMVKDYLRKSSHATHWSVGYSHTIADCFQNLTMQIEANPADFIYRLSAEMAHLKKMNCVNSRAYNQENAWGARICNDRSSAIKRMDEIAENAPWSEIKALKMVLQSKEIQGIDLCISNGTPIRYAQILTRTIPHATYCNRGVSGIEGSTSTALGVAIGSRRATWLLTGDMSLTHDLGGLYAAKYLDTPLKIIVVSNGGGGIFRFISASNTLPIREEMLCVDTDPDIRGIASAFGFEYLEADDEESLQEKFAIFAKNSGKTILNIIAPPEESARILRDALSKNINP